MLLCGVTISFPTWGQPSPSSVSGRIEALLDARYQTNEPGAVVLVALDGKPVIRAGYGVADLANHVLLDADHSLAIGSVSKQFTAAAIMLLHEKGKLSVQDDISKYFPEAYRYPGVQIRHLLTHSSGIRDLFGIEAWRRNLARDLSREETLSMIFNEDPEFVPGEQTAYSNSGYYLLGVICEKISNMTLNQFLNARIIEPLQMTHTSFLDNSPRDFPTALGYEKTENGYQLPSEVSPTRFYGGGSMITTLDDLLKWDEALYSDTLLSVLSRDMLFEPMVLSNKETSNYACGWEVATFGDLEILGHGGGINGYVSQVYRVPSRHIYVALLSNMVDRSNKEPVSRMAQLIIQILLEEDQTFQDTEGIVLSTEELKVYEGDYQLPDGSVRRILAKEGRLYYEQSPGKEAELRPQSRTHFKAGMASTVTFSFNESDRVEQFEIYTGTGRSIVGRKLN